MQEREAPSEGLPWGRSSLEHTRRCCGGDSAQSGACPLLWGREAGDAAKPKLPPRHLPLGAYLHSSQMSSLAIAFCQRQEAGQSALALSRPWPRPKNRLKAACVPCLLGLFDGSALRRGTEKEL